MNYKQAVTYLISHFPQYQKTGMAGYKPYPARMLSLVSWLGNPQLSFPCIHIAGTNGKGSVAHMLASVLQTAGLRTGLYTSPHLIDFRERIKVNGQMIFEKNVASFVTKFVEKRIPEIGEEKPSFFDMTTAMAFQYFATEEVDIAVIETGLGGRLDSTNILTAPSVLLSIITNIGLDHCDILGQTKESIAKEKAGIIKQGVPVVLGEYDAAAFPVIQQQAARQGSRLVCAYENTNESFPVEGDNLYQRKNVLTAVTALSVLKETQPHLMACVTEASVAEGLQYFKTRTGLRGRWERVRENPTVILDTGHNAAGLSYLRKQLTYEKYDKLYIVYGVVREKELSLMAHLLPDNAWYFFTQPSIERAMPAKLLSDWAVVQGFRGEVVPDIREAYNKALSGAGTGDLVLVTGSTFTVADVLSNFFCT
ncbi:MAG: folylpolyglutamate synthase/dihydrofolate synthase family protein [Bacteroidales bacterium]|jgi:dihydrofolate synthase/folylpolyglutamate synthase